MLNRCFCYYVYLEIRHLLVKPLSAYSECSGSPGHSKTHKKSATKENTGLLEKVLSLHSHSKLAPGKYEVTLVSH